MNYWQKYQNRVLRGAKSTKDRITNDLEKSFLKYLNQSPTCVEVPISKPNQFPILDELSLELVSIIDLSNNDKKTLDEKELLTRKNLDIDIGCYLYHKNSWWLVVFEELRTIESYKKYIIKKCNQIIKYKNNNKIYDIPVSILNMTLYADGLQDNVYTTRQDAKRDVWYGVNEITKNIDLKTRFMLPKNTVFEITHINDFEYPGLVKVLVNQVELIGLDDKENNIAWNPIYDENVENIGHIKGNKFILQGGENKYSVNNIEQVKWFLDNDKEYVKLIELPNNECLLKASHLSQHIGSKVTLNVKDVSKDTVVDSLVITIRG